MKKNLRRKNRGIVREFFVRKFPHEMSFLILENSEISDNYYVFSEKQGKIIGESFGYFVGAYVPLIKILEIHKI